MFEAADSEFLDVTDNETDWDLGTGAFTIDMWVNLATTNIRRRCSGIIVNTINKRLIEDGYRFDLVEGELRWFSRCPEGVIQINTSVYPVPGDWHHLAAVRSEDGNTLTIYVDGEAKGSQSGISTYQFNTDNGLVIGKIVSGVDDFYFDGYMDEIRINKGVARWDDNFDTSLPLLPYTPVVP